jgi:selenocysteine-specific translation elongation factor
MWKSRESGTVIQVVVKNGHVRVGDWLTAGGWVGCVQRIVAHDKNRGIDSATAGEGVRLSVALDKNSGDPRPLGDKCFLFKGKEMALFLMNQNQLEFSFGEFDIIYFCFFK